MRSYAFVDIMFMSSCLRVLMTSLNSWRDASRSISVTLVKQQSIYRPFYTSLIGSRVNLGCLSVSLRHSFPFFCIKKPNLFILRNQKAISGKSGKYYICQRKKLSFNSLIKGKFSKFIKTKQKLMLFFIIFHRLV